MRRTTARRGTCLYPMPKTDNKPRGGNMTTARKIFGMAAIAASVAGMTGCEGALGLDANANGSLAFQVNKVDSGLLGLSSSAPNEMSSGGHTIVLSSATMTASELELKGF